MLTWPKCTKRSCAGRSSGEAAFMDAARAASSSGSLSSAKSQTASWPSEDVVVSTEDSKGHHSRDVTGLLQVNKLLSVAMLEIMEAASLGAPVTASGPRPAAGHLQMASSFDSSRKFYFTDIAGPVHHKVSIQRTCLVVTLGEYRSSCLLRA